LEAHLSGCRACAAEASSLREVWDRMEGMLPEQEPAPKVSARFYAMLEGYKQGQEAAKSRAPWWQAWMPHPAFQAAMAALLLCVGGLTGFLITGRTSNGGTELADLRKEVHSTRQLMVLSMMQQQSASERIEGVTFTRKMARPDPEVKEALFQAVESDPNVNVRLAALDALRPMLNQPGLLKRLLDSLIKQPSPLVQVSMIDLMVETKHRDALSVLQQLKADKDANSTVRERAGWAIGQLGGEL
jgi:hypothetical protein